jgi:hypothetical protein
LAPTVSLGNEKKLEILMIVPPSFLVLTTPSSDLTGDSVEVGVVILLC